MHKYLLLLLLGVYALFPIGVYSQKPDYRLFDNISLGTEAFVISCFLQDTQGLVWIGSNKGLFSYDGYAAHAHFTFGARSNTRIYCGTVVDSTYLYLGADNGLLVYNYRMDMYELSQVEFPKDIRTMALQGNTLWLGTLNGLFTYQLDTKQLSPVTKGLPHQTIYSLIKASDGTLYIGTYNGFCRNIPGRRDFETIPLPATTNKNNLFVNSLLEDPLRGCIWVGTEGCLFRYEPSTSRMEQIDAFRNNSVKSLALDGSGQLLVGTDNGVYVHQEGEVLLHLVHDSRNPQSLSNNIIWTIFTDREQNVWLGTDYDISMAKHNNALRHIPISQITGTGEGNQFYHLLRDSRGIYWLGGTNGLIRYNRPASGGQEVAWYKMGDKRYPLSHNRVRHIYEDRENQLWVATDGSVSRYDYEKGQFVNYHIVDKTRRYNANWAYSLYEDTEGKLWIATCLGGILVVDKHRLMASGGRQYIADESYSMQNGLSGMFINQMVSDRDGNIWALLYNSPHSIEKIDVRTKKITHFTAGELQGVKTPNYLLCDKQGHIWIGFPGGVMRITPSDNSTRMMLFDAFTHYEVLSMVEADNRIWISTTDGFWVVNQQTMEMRRLNITDKRFTGMFYDAVNREFYLGMTDGFAISTTEALLTKQPDHSLLLTAFYVNNQLFVPDEKGEEMQSVRYSQRIELQANQNNLVFELSDLPYSLEEKNKLIYRLEGVDKEWMLLTATTNRIVYNNLNYGNYQLIVSKLDATGKPSDQAYTLTVHIAPPWYYTGWAKTIYVLLFLALLAWTLNFFRVKNRLKLERMEKEKILEQSQAKMDFFTNLAHDLKTPLSMIIAPVSRLLPEVKNKHEKEQLELVHRNAMKLNSLIHRGLDFNRVDSGNNALLIQSKIELVAFARDLFALYEEEKSKEKKLSFLFYTNCEKIYIQMDAIKLESILDNLLSNAVKYTLDGGQITLSLHEQDNGRDIRITVADTGVGVPVQDQPYVFQRFFQSSKTMGKKEGTGIGLYLVKTYAELHGGSILLVSDEGVGTTITLDLPVLCVDALPLPAQRRAVGGESALPAAATDAPTILIVDDNPEIAEFIYQILHTKYRCILAENGKEGVERCKELLPNLVIADVMMPIMDGLEMVRRIKKYMPTSAIPVIMLTAKTDQDTELESIRLHIDAFIAKPFEPDILLSRVEQLLHIRQTHEVKARMEVIATPKEIEAVSLDEKFLAEVIRLIEEHITDSELNVNALCEWTYTNNKQMYRKVKQLTGMTPVEYIKSIRMKKAAMLLQQQKFTVAEVMYMVGFNNHSYFSKCFQAEFGVTPKQYVG